MTDREIMVRLMEHDAVSHADMIHLLSTGKCEILYADSERGVALKHPCGTVYCTSFGGDIMPMIEAIGPDQSLINAETKEISDWYRENLHWDFLEECRLWLYDRSKGFLYEGPYRFRRMTAEDHPLLRANYGFGSDEELMGCIERGDMFAMMDSEGGTMAFGGFHPEGSVGLLHVFPRFRGRGIGAYMESFLLNEAMRRGMAPFCNVYVSNAASIRIQEKLGLSMGEALSWWIWPRND